MLLYCGLCSSLNPNIVYALAFETSAVNGTTTKPSWGESLEPATFQQCLFIAEVFGASKTAVTRERRTKLYGRSNPFGPRPSCPAGQPKKFSSRPAASRGQFSYSKICLLFHCYLAQYVTIIRIILPEYLSIT